MAGHGAARPCAAREGNIVVRAQQCAVVMEGWVRMGATGDKQHIHFPCRPWRRALGQCQPGAAGAGGVVQRGGGEQGVAALHCGAGSGGQLRCAAGAAGRGRRQRCDHHRGAADLGHQCGALWPAADAHHAAAPCAAHAQPCRQAGFLCIGMQCAACLSSYRLQG